MKELENKTIHVYKNVFTRNESKMYELSKFIVSPFDILNDFGVNADILIQIKNELNKDTRTILKRENLPAIDFSQSGLMSIAIDNIGNNEQFKNGIIEQVSKLDTCFLVQETASGNIVCFFRYDCTVSDFPFLYYKIYLELTLLLSVSIDFLPEVNRLRYLNCGKIFHLNTDSKILTEVLRVQHLPYINTQVGKSKARRIVYGSR